MENTKMAAAKFDQKSLVISFAQVSKSISTFIYIKSLI